MKTNNSLVQRFCTPPSLPITEFEKKAFADAEKMEFSFEVNTLSGYSWGEGKNVLLVHGWGSRASHMAFLGRFLAKAGFRVIAYDAPAHSSADAPLKKTTSNMFEYCRAISAVVKSLGHVYAVIGHSFGSACAAFTAAGLSAFNDQKFHVGKLVLMSTPPTLVDVYKSFCRRDEIGEEGLALLKSTLESEFGFASEDYTMAAAFQKLSTDILLVHDSEDEEFPVLDIYALQKSKPSAGILVTTGSGHQKILANRTMMAGVKDFLIDKGD
jgi:pimeloyl-ACP methyl ester carboxylesterase